MSQAAKNIIEADPEEFFKIYGEQPTVLLPQPKVLFY
jgi:hypothetical protein